MRRRPGAPCPDHCRLTEHGETRSPQCSAPAAAAAYMALAAEARRRVAVADESHELTLCIAATASDCGQWLQWRTHSGLNDRKKDWKIHKHTVFP